MVLSKTGFSNVAFVWNQSRIRLIGIVQVSVRLAALPIPEYLDFHSGYSAPRSRIAGNIFQNIFLFQNIPKRTRPKGQFALADKFCNNW